LARKLAEQFRHWNAGLGRKALGEQLVIDERLRLAVVACAHKLEIPLVHADHTPLSERPRQSKKIH